MTDDATFNVIRTLINGYDPEGLLEFAPIDEYDPEVRELTALVRGPEKIDADTITRLWLWYFGSSNWPAARPGDVAEVAAKLEAVRRGIRGR